MHRLPGGAAGSKAEQVRPVPLQMSVEPCRGQHARAPDAFHFPQDGQSRFVFLHLGTLRLRAAVVARMIPHATCGLGGDIMTSHAPCAYAMGRALSQNMSRTALVSPAAEKSPHQGRDHPPADKPADGTA